MIQLQFICEHAIASQAIAWFSHGHFSHVDAVQPVNGCLLGARSDFVGREPAGVESRPFNYAKFSRRVVFTVPATADQERKFWSFLNEQIGKPYDYQAIWGFVLNRNWREDDSWICSELQARALEVAGILPACLYLACNQITPRDLAFVISAIGATPVAY